jgi:hypothetical protein
MARMPRGGKRENSGRKPLDPSGETRRRVWFFVTSEEKSKLREYLDYLRTQQQEKN